MEIGKLKDLITVHRTKNEVIIEEHGPPGESIELYLDPDEAEDLGHLLLIAARKVLP